MFNKTGIFVDNHLNIDFGKTIDKTVKVTIININGQLVQSGQLRSAKIDIQNLVSGFYTLKLLVDNQQIVITKVLKFD